MASSRQHVWDRYDTRVYWSAASSHYLRKWWCDRCGRETVQLEWAKPEGFAWPDGKGSPPGCCDESLVESVLTS